MAKPTAFDLEDFLPYLLNQAAEVTSRSFQSAYRTKYGMTRTQWRVMANLGKHDSMSAVEICKQTFIEKTKVSRAVHALEVSGFLKRTTSPNDRRTEQLTLSPAGRKAFSDIGTKATAFDQTLRKNIGETKARNLQTVLRELIAST
jgi:DNA-binding MarR family transcriptional regulator